MTTLFTSLGKRARAVRCNERGNSSSERGDLKAAERAYRAALAIDPEFAAPYYNLGLLFKYAHDWRECFEWNRRAVELDGAHEGAWWNLAIAATALERWDHARRAWQRCGLPIEAGSDPTDFPCGIAPVRLDPEGRGEVVWCERIDPARAVVRSIPLPESEIGYGDILLTDGAPNGSRRIAGRDVAVFDALGSVHRSRFSTCVVQLEGLDEGAVERLADLAEPQNIQVENWTSSLRVLCRECSEGQVHPDHVHQPAAPSGLHRVALAARDPSVAQRLVLEFVDSHPSVRLLSFDVALPRSPD